MSCNNVQILNYNHNVVALSNGNTIVITDKVKCNSITIPQPVTHLLQINSPGPQGPSGLQGPAGPAVDTGSFATTGSNTFIGNQIISGSDGFILQIHGANINPWAFGIYNDTYNPTQAALAGFIWDDGRAAIGTEVDKPLEIYTNANYYTPTLTISSSGVIVDNTLIVNQGITGSLQGTSSWAYSASNAVSSSYATSASYALSSSYALSVSYATSASYALSSSYATNASSSINSDTASNILGGKAPHIPYFITDTTLATSSLYQSGSTAVIINLDVNTTANPEALFVWQPSQTSFNVISGKGNLDNYLQLNIQNNNAGPIASSDVVATANNGNETTNYIDMGINSSEFAGDLGDINDAYLYSTGRHLHVGNASNYPVQFFAGGLDTEANRKFELNPNGDHNITGSLEIDTDLTVLGGITGSLYGTASWAENAVTSSYVAASNVNGTVTSASYALNASNADNATYASTAGNGGVTQLVAGSGIILVPAGGTGAVTVASTGVGGVTIISGSNVTQSFSNTSTWTFTHNLQTRVPVITVFDTNYNQIIPQNITLTDTASATITFPVAVSGFAVASVGGTSATALSASYALQSTYATTASYYTETDPVFVAKSASLATTGSNIFKGNQTISGSLIITGSNTLIGNKTISGSVFITGSKTIIGNNIVTGSMLTTGSIVLVGNQTITGSLTVSGSGTFINIGPAVFSGSVTLLNGATGSLLGTASFSTTSSYSSNADLLDGKDSTTFATTGSNTFIGNQVVTGSLFTSGSNTLIGSTTLTGSFNVSGSTIQTGNNTLTGNTVLSGSISISGSQTFKGNLDLTGSLTVSGSTFQIGNNTLSGNTVLSGSIIISGSTTNEIIGNTEVLGQFNVSGSSTFRNSQFTVTGSTFVKGITSISGSTNITGSLNVVDGDINIVSGSSFRRWGNKLFNYGAFSDYTTQTGSADTAYPIRFNTTDVALGISLSGSSAMKIENKGIYNFQWSGQLHQGANASVVSVWLKINGTDVPGSRGDVTLASNDDALPSWNYVLSFNANDAVELYWSSTRSTTSWVFSPTGSTPPRPSTASIIATITQIA